MFSSCSRFHELRYGVERENVSVHVRLVSKTRMHFDDSGFLDPRF